MANGVNKVILIGNLGKDPEIRFVANGNAVCNFSVAVNESWKDKGGNKKERTEWVNIVVWGKLAEVCAEHLSKGKQVYLEGRLQTRQWDDKEGNKRHTTEMVANQMRMLGGGGDEQKGRPTASDDVPF